MLATSAQLCEERCCADANCTLWHYGTTLPVQGVGCEWGQPLRCVGVSQVAAAGGRRTTDASDMDTTGSAPVDSGEGALENLLLALGVLALVVVSGCAFCARYRWSQSQRERSVHPHPVGKQALAKGFVQTRVLPSNARKQRLAEPEPRARAPTNIPVPPRAVEPARSTWIRAEPPPLRPPTLPRPPLPPLKFRTGITVEWQAVHDQRTGKSALAVGGKCARPRCGVQPASASLAEDLLAVALEAPSASPPSLGVRAGMQPARSRTATDLRAEDV